MVFWSYLRNQLILLVSIIDKFTFCMALPSSAIPTCLKNRTLCIKYYRTFCPVPKNQSDILILVNIFVLRFKSKVKYGRKAPEKSTYTHI